MENTTIEALQDMKQILFEKGWVQGSFGNEEGFCLMGSYTRSGLTRKYRHNVLESVTEALYRVLGGMSVLGFNDRVAKSFNEIIDVIDAAIMDEKERL